MNMKMKQFINLKNIMMIIIKNKLKIIINFIISKKILYKEKKNYNK